MKRIVKAIVAMILMGAVIFAAGCKKDPDNGENNNGGDNGGGSGGGTIPTTEGVYLGIIGFNENLFQKEIGLLNSSTQGSFNAFVNNLRANMGTGLYYADYTALNKMQSYGEPPKLKDVAIVTFTDGLDNVSTSNSQMDPEGYGSISAYRTALHNKILNEKIHGKSVSAYTIGLRGMDVADENEFRMNLNMLASSPSNVFEVTNMYEALQHFRTIAEELYSSITTVNLKLKVPGGFDDGQVIRFTFDIPSNAGNSVKFIECTYRRNGDLRRLENISYHGLAQGATSLSSISQAGAYFWFEFENLTNVTGTAISQFDISLMQLWKKIDTGWQKDSEFEPGSSSEVSEDKSSALIMLVLDCTTSLGDDFETMKTGAEQFIEVLCSSGGSGGNGGSGNVVAPEGAIKGLFTVSLHKVFFSKGNLQYNAFSNTWRFAEHQWDYVGTQTPDWQGNLGGTIIGCDNASISNDYNGWIDLFGWGTSGWNNGNTYYHPWDWDNSNASLYGPIGEIDLADEYANSDWGQYNVISNGGMIAGKWRVMDTGEWNHLLNNRHTISGAHYAKAQVQGVNGIILLPDNWNLSVFSLNNTDQEDAVYTSNIIDSTTWESVFEVNGCVFLPAAGFRNGTTVYNVGYRGCYWTSDAGNNDMADCPYFDETRIGIGRWDYRPQGSSVRLVCFAE